MKLREGRTFPRSCSKFRTGAQVSAPHPLSSALHGCSLLPSPFSTLTWTPSIRGGSCPSPCQCLGRGTPEVTIYRPRVLDALMAPSCPSAHCHLLAAGLSVAADCIGGGSGRGILPGVVSTTDLPLLCPLLAAASLGWLWDGKQTGRSGSQAAGHMEKPRPEREGLSRTPAGTPDPCPGCFRPVHRDTCLWSPVGRGTSAIQPWATRVECSIQVGATQKHSVSPLKYEEFAHKADVSMAAQHDSWHHLAQCLAGPGCEWVVEEQVLQPQALQPWLPGA